MKYIVFDLEFTVVRFVQRPCEIIEFGAIELRQAENGDLRMTDLFHSYVRPSVYPVLSSETVKFTGVTQHNVDQAPCFSEALTLFKEWLGQEETYYLCAWSGDDKQQLIRQCRAEDLDLSWLRNYNDIQHPISLMHNQGMYRRIGLTQALELQGLTYCGRPHTALDDAFNTARLFERNFSKLTLEHNNAAEEPLYSSRLVYSTGTEANLPFSQLAHLLGQAI